MFLHRVVWANILLFDILHRDIQATAPPSVGVGTPPPPPPPPPTSTATALRDLYALHHPHAHHPPHHHPHQFAAASPIPPPALQPHPPHPATQGQHQAAAAAAAAAASAASLSSLVLAAASPHRLLELSRLGLRHYDLASHVLSQQGAVTKLLGKDESVGVNFVDLNTTANLEFEIDLLF
ncbi:hypothetical protein J437_LFUL001500 [Ladona fulva]|uniref:Uncharacterized protein n=1 Tax=Ladona fulva TaxID=123851 RepID=A0A8K0JW48_LADFU|nr:hypothetical protein J437_LFUL001500 [Ladona fulva]